MKKKTISCVLLILAMILSACGKDAEPETYAGVDMAAGEWTDAADAAQESSAYYSLAPMSDTKDEGSVVMTAFAFQSKAALVTVPTPIPEGYTLRLGEEEIFNSPNIFYAAAVSDEGIWVMDNNYTDGVSTYALTLLTAEGSAAKELALSALFPGESFKSTLICTGGNLYLFTEKNKLITLDSEGNLLGSANLPDDAAYQVPGADGINYIVQPTADGNKLYPIDPASGKLGKPGTLSAGKIYGGYGDARFLMSNGDGLYAVAADGTVGLIVLWANCSAPLNRLLNVSPLGNDEFLLMCGDGPFVLRPADPGTAAQKTTLKLAAISPSGALVKKVAAFNAADSDYSVVIHDYSEGGSLDGDTALKRLNADIISGKLPDMVCFTRISPYPYIRKSLLTNLGDYINTSDQISPEDISILKALENDGKIYFISADFDFETLVARYSYFGDSYGWTLEDYIEAEKGLPGDVETIHNMTHDSFVNCIVSRYIRTAVDWEEGVCNFNTPEFISLLEAGSRIRETPEGAESSYGYGPTKVGEGTRFASLSWVDTVWKLAYEESTAGCQLSFIGWPTADGSCGSDIRLLDPIGIISGGENADGCWRFIQYMLVNTSEDADHIPTYTKTLREKIELAKKDEAAPIKMSDSDADRFFELLSEIENTAIYDEAVLGIIQRECAPFFSGDRTAAQAAENIQSKVSIYIAEQFG